MTESKKGRLQEMEVRYLGYITALCILGSLVSVYLVYEHYEENQSVCDINNTISCGIINKSAFSVLLGVPIAIFGVLWYLALLFFCHMALDNEKDAYIWITLI